MQTLTPCNAKVVSTRTAVGQFKGLSSRGRKYLGRFNMQALTPCDAKVVSTRTQQSVSSKGNSRRPMERYTKASTHSQKPD